MNKASTEMPTTILLDGVDLGPIESVKITRTNEEDPQSAVFVEIVRAPSAAQVQQAAPVGDGWSQIQVLVEALDNLECEASAEIDPNTSLNVAINEARKILAVYGEGPLMELSAYRASHYSSSAQPQTREGGDAQVGDFVAFDEYYAGRVTHIHESGQLTVAVPTRHNGKEYFYTDLKNVTKLYADQPAPSVLREALEAADCVIERLHKLWLGKGPVRDLDEMQEWYRISKEKALATTAPADAGEV